MDHHTENGIENGIENIDLVRTTYQLLDAGDLDTAQQRVTRDFVAHVPGAPEPLVGRDTWRRGAQLMHDAFPDLTTTVEDIFATGDKVTVLVQFEGTHSGAFQGIAATGRRVSFRSVEVYRVTGGQIAEEWVAPDMLSLLEQISGTSRPTEEPAPR